MADNYIEKRMEELRSGRLALKKAIPGIRHKAQRVIVAGGCHGFALVKALEFRKQGCRVAVFDADETVGKQMAHDHAIRFHNVALNDFLHLQREIHSLLSAWRGIDVIVGEEKITGLIGELIREWKDSLPIPDKTIPEIVIIPRKNLNDET